MYTLTILKCIQLNNAYLIPINGFLSLFKMLAFVQTVLLFTYFSLFNFTFPDPFGFKDGGRIESVTILMIC